MSLDPRDGQRIQTLIDAAHRILIISHVDPDGDAIGSLLGLGWLLRGCGKTVTLVCQDPVPEPVAWLPGTQDIVREACGAHDVAICLDCSDLERMGRAWQPGLTVLLVNIDHHVTNTRFAQVNWVDPASVATAQMVLALAEALGWELNEPAARCLLAGLLTDTRGLRTANVDAQALRAVQRLVEAGASVGETARRALDERPLAVVRLWAQALDRVVLEDGILWTELDRSPENGGTLSGDGTAGLSNFLSGVREAKVVVVFREREGGEIDVSLRAAPGYDVAALAVRLGGGGHPQASGCTLPGPLVTVRERVLHEVRRSLSRE